MNNYCPRHQCHYASKDCPVCLRVRLDRSSPPASSPSQADTGADAMPVYLSAPFARGDVLRLLGFMAGEIPELHGVGASRLLECLKRFESSLPAQAQPAMAQADVPPTPPSRTSNAASENGAASFLLDIVASNIEDLIHRVNKGLEADLTKGDLGWLVAARHAIGRMKRTEVSGEPAKQGRQRLGEIPAASFTGGESREAGEAAGLSLTSSLTIDVEKRDDWYTITCAEMPGLLLAGKDFMVLLDDLPLAWRILRQLNDVSPDTCAFTNPPRSYESQASTVFDAHGTAQHVAPASPSIPSGCGSGVSEGLNIGSEPSVPHAPNAIPLSEPAIRAAVYGCTDAQCVCGRCAPVRMAIDPWQGLGKTWSDK